MITSPLSSGLMLAGKVIFLTGGSTGIGQDCAKAYAAQGANVVLCARHGDKAALVASKLPTTFTKKQQHYGIPCDVSKGPEVEAAIEFILDKFEGQLDGIHNNAGIVFPAKMLQDTTEEEWDDLFTVNLKGVYWTTRYGLDALKASGGVILNTSSMAGSIGQASHCAYAGTKGAMDALTKSMALDYAPYKIRVNAVSPAGVWTPALRKWCQEQSSPNEIEYYLDKIHPLGYCPEGNVVADASVFLLSDQARFITGCILPVSGGLELGYRRLN